jgi:methionyl-tRNA formyltransferase
MRLVFFGSGAFGVPTLKRLAAEHDVALVVTQPDKPAGRRRLLSPTAVAEFSQSANLRTEKTDDVNAEPIVEMVRSVDAEAFVVIAFGQKLGRALLDEMFAINLHASLLPKYRGAAPIQWAMMNGERETGLSVITLADRMDTGDILGQVTTPIEPLETAGELHDRLSEMGPDLVAEVLLQHERGTLKPVAQDESHASHAPKLTKADGTVCFDQPAVGVRQRVHGLTPWPGCMVRVDGRPLRLHRVDVADRRTEHARAGIILGDLTIACASGAIRPLEVQAPGGRLMSYAAYCNGQPITVGAIVEPMTARRIEST